jgi:hypothetical protein
MNPSPGITSRIPATLSQLPILLTISCGSANSDTAARITAPNISARKDRLLEMPLRELAPTIQGDDTFRCLHPDSTQGRSILNLFKWDMQKLSEPPIVLGTGA